MLRILKKLYEILFGGYEMMMKFYEPYFLK